MRTGKEAGVEKMLARISRRFIARGQQVGDESFGIFGIFLVLPKIILHIHGIRIFKLDVIINTNVYKDMINLVLFISKNSLLQKKNSGGYGESRGCSRPGPMCRD